MKIKAELDDSELGTSLAQPSQEAQLLDSPFIKRECHTCLEPETADDPLKYCSRCKSPFILYCSRECQEKHWKEHKKKCKLNNTVFAFLDTPIEKPENKSIPFKLTDALEHHIRRPFHAMRAKKWLHNRPEQDVYTLLIDVYRLRMEDVYMCTGIADQDGVYGTGNGSAGLQRLLKLIESKPDLLPDWWSPEKALKCAVFGSFPPNDWSDLACAVTVDDVVQYYGDPSMPNQLRLFGEQVYGSPPGDMMGGDAILAVHVAGERV